MYTSRSTGALAPTSESVSFGTSLVGKLAIVTGANTGVGREIARVLALRGAHVWMCGRNEERTEAAIEDIRHRMRTRRCHQSGACCSCRKAAPCPGFCCSHCQLAPKLIEDMRLSIGDKADNLEWREVHLERMFSVRTFVDEIEATVKDFHAGSPARVVKKPVKPDAFFASLYESRKDREKREKREAKEAKQEAKANKGKGGKNAEKKGGKYSKKKRQSEAPVHDAWAVKHRPSFSKVDLLYLNAGVTDHDVALTPDGHDYSYQVNYLAHFYITHELIARGLLAPDARVVVTQTETAALGPKRSWPQPDVLGDPGANLKAAAGETRKAAEKAAKKASKQAAKRSAEAKKMLLYMQVELARRLANAGSRITINGCAPGYAVTDIDKIKSSRRRRLVRCLKCCCGQCCSCCDIGQDLDTGAATLLWLGASEEAAGKSGLMWHEMTDQKIPERVTGPSMSAEEEWIADKKRRKRKQAELTEAGEIHNKMEKDLAAGLTRKALELDYASLPADERQQLEHQKEEAKEKWLQEDSVALAFWEATERLLTLEPLALDAAGTSTGGAGTDTVMESHPAPVPEPEPEREVEVEGAAGSGDGRRGPRVTFADEPPQQPTTVSMIGTNDQQHEHEQLVPAAAAAAAAVATDRGEGSKQATPAGGPEALAGSPAVVAPRVPSRWQFEGADHVANEEIKNASVDDSERLLLAMLEKDTAQVQKLVTNGR